MNRTKQEKDIIHSKLLVKNLQEIAISGSHISKEKRSKVSATKNKGYSRKSSSAVNNNSNGIISFEKASLENHKLYKQLFHNSSDMIFLHPIYSNRKPGCFLDANKAVIKKLGYSKKEIKKLKPADIVIDENLKEIAGETQKLVSDKILLFKKTLISKKGKRIPVEIHSHVFMLNGQQMAFSIARDVSEREKITNELREREERYRQAIENSPNPIFSVDKKARILSWNKSCEGIFKYNLKEIIGKSLTTILIKDAEQKRMLKDYVKNVYNKKTFSGIVLKFKCRDNTIRIFNSRLYPLLSEGQIFSCVFANTDITENLHKEEELNENRRFLTSLIKNTPGMIYRSLNDVCHTKIFISEGCKKITGYYPEELIGNSKICFNDLILKEYRIFVRKTWLKKLKAKENIRIEYPITTADGQIKWVLEQGAGVYNEYGRLKYIEGIIIDNNEYKKTVDALKESEERYRGLYQNIPIGMYRTSPDGKILMANNALVQMLGYLSLEELQQRNLENDDFEPGYIRKEFKRLVENTKDVVAIESVWKKKNGDRIYVNENAKCIRSPKGKVFYYEGTVEDITEKINAVLELKENERKYRQLFNEMISGFALHEIICDDKGIPIDYKFLIVNKAFEKVTGLKAENILGKNVLEILPDTEKSWIEKYGHVALTGEPLQFESYTAPLGKYFEVRAHSPEHGKFVVIFNDITEHKKNIEKVKHLNHVLSAIRFVNQLIVKEKDKDKLIQSICDLLSKTRGYNHVWIALYGKNESFTNFAFSGESTLFEKIKTDLLNNRLTECQIMALKQDTPVYFKYPYEECGECPYKNILESSGTMTIKLDHNKTTYGIMSISTNFIFIEESDELNLFDEVAHDIAFALHDIEEEEMRLTAESALKGKEELLSRTGSIAKVGGWEYDLLTNSYTITDEVYSIYNIPKSTKLTDKEFYLCYSEETREVVKRFFTNSVEQQISFEAEFEFTSFTKKKKWVRISTKPLVENGTVVKLIGAIQDITESKKYEEELRKLNRAVEQSPAVIVITDKDGLIEYVNPKFSELTGYSFEEVYLKKPSILKSGEKTREEYRKLWQTILSGNEWRGEFHNRKKNGELFWEYASISPVKNDNGEITHFIAVKEDITERKKIFQELIVAKEEAEKADKLKSEFLAQMSHEIRSPLNVILNFFSLIQNDLRGKLSSELCESFDSINSAGQRITRTIDMILNMAELQTGNFQPLYKQINLRDDILSTVIKQYKLNAEAKKLDFKFIYNTDKLNLIADEYSLGQIFANLVDNSIKYTKSGKVIVEVDLNGSHDLQVKVIDTGVGISKEYMPSLFHPFSQEEQGYTRTYEGNGLGLALVKRYCEINKAEISVESNKGKGTTFTITFK